MRTIAYSSLNVPIRARRTVQARPEPPRSPRSDTHAAPLSVSQAAGTATRLRPARASGTILRFYSGACTGPAGSYTAAVTDSWEERTAGRNCACNEQACNRVSRQCLVIRGRSLSPCVEAGSLSGKLSSRSRSSLSALSCWPGQPRAHGLGRAAPITNCRGANPPAARRREEACVAYGER